MNSFMKFLGLVKRSGNLIAGYNKCEEAIGKKKIELFIFSSSISDRSKEKFLKVCKEYKIPYVEGLSKEELGYSIGISEINIIGIIDKNMADKLLSTVENK